MRTVSYVAAAIAFVVGGVVVAAVDSAAVVHLVQLSLTFPSELTGGLARQRSGTVTFDVVSGI